MQLIGVDVGFSETRATPIVATLSAGVVSVARTTSDARSMLALMAHVRNAEVIAIDAPVPPNCDCRERRCESLFARGSFQRRCKPGFSHVKGTGQALRKASFSLAETLRGLCRVRMQPIGFPLITAQSSIIEAFPNAFLGVCIAEDVYASMPVLNAGRSSIGYIANGAGQEHFIFSANWFLAYQNPSRRTAQLIQTTNNVQR